MITSRQTDPALRVGKHENSKIKRAPGLPKLHRYYVAVVGPPSNCRKVLLILNIAHTLAHVLFVHIRMVYPVDKSYRRRLVWIPIR